MEPASIRYKNPGAMWGRTGKRPSADREVPTNYALALKWGSTQTFYLSDGLGQGNNIAVFPTYVQGICAQIDLWRTARYRNKKFAKAIAIWCGGNSVEGYISFVLARVPGMTRNTVIDDSFLRGPMAVPFLKAQAWHEAGKPYPAADEDWVEAQKRVFAVEPDPTPITKSNIARGGGVVVATETADAGIQINDALDKVTQAKNASDNLGLTDTIVATMKVLVYNPRFWVAVAIIVICGGIIYWRWRDHKQGR